MTSVNKVRRWGPCEPDDVCCELCIEFHLTSTFASVVRMLLAADFAPIAAVDISFQLSRAAIQKSPCSA